MESDESIEKLSRARDIHQWSSSQLALTDSTKLKKRENLELKEKELWETTFLIQDKHRIQH